MSDTTNTMDLAAEIARLRAENAAMTAKLAAKQTLCCKVSEKGAVSVIGLQRFPVTLYKQQWERVLGAAPMIQAFIAAHPELKTKE